MDISNGFNIHVFYLKSEYYISSTVKVIFSFGNKLVIVNEILMSDFMDEMIKDIKKNPNAHIPYNFIKDNLIKKELKL